jgi:hypothetical protein
VCFAIVQNHGDCGVKPHAIAVRGQPCPEKQCPGIVARPQPMGRFDDRRRRCALFDFRNGRHNLVERALSGRLIRTPPHQLRSMPEAVACDVVESHLDYKLGPKWLPFAAALGAPPARTTGRFARESRPAAKPFELSCQSRPVRVGDRRGKADVVELASSIVKAQQQ